MRLNRVIDGAPVTMLAKIEGRNPAYSVKCRIGASMIWDAERRGILKPGKELIEPTSGNTGIALAFVAAARGYKITLLMPETMSLERRKVLKALGAKLILTDGALGMGASIERAEEMVATDPDRFVLLQQFQNPANPEIHFKTTGPEIFEDTQGNVDVLVAGIGTGRNHHRNFALLQAGEEASADFGRRGAGGKPGHRAGAGGRGAASGSARHSRHRARDLFRARWI